MSYTSIKYGFWAQMSMWPIIVRAGIVIGFTAICVYFLLKLIYPGIVCLPLKLLDIFLKGIFWTIARCLEEIWILSGMNYPQRTERLNRILAIGDSMSTKLCRAKDRLARKKKISFVIILFIYGIVMLLIGLPNLLRDKIADEYLPAFSTVSDLYSRWESDKLEAAKGYTPLFKSAEETVPQTTEAIETIDFPEEDTGSQILLTLSKNGWGGANIRKEASAKSDIIVSVSGDVKLVYIGEENSWVNVRLEDGTEGWIKSSLVDGLPEK